MTAITTISDLIGVVSTILSFITLLVVFFTLQEMKKQRNNQYKPLIVLERTEFRLCQNNAEKELMKQILPNASCVTINNSIGIKVKNLGLYPARDVEILIDKANIKKITNQFKEVDFTDIVISPDGSDYINSSNGSEYHFDHKFIFQVPYLLGDGGNEETIMIPNIYTLLAKKILIHEPFQWDFDYLNIEVNVNYSDMCGKKYNKQIKLYFDIKGMSVSREGEGGGDFVLSMLKSPLRRYYQM